MAATTPLPRLLVLATMLSGAAALVDEMVWVRLLGQVGEQIADVREHARVRRRVRARRAADGRLIDVDHLVDVLQPIDAVVRADGRLRAV